VIVPQVLSSPPPAWYLLGALAPCRTLLSSTRSGTPTAICLVRCRLVDALVFFQPPTEPQSTYCVVRRRLVEFNPGSHESHPSCKTLLSAHLTPPNLFFLVTRWGTYPWPCSHRRCYLRCIQRESPLSEEYANL
jgi:hypothetical protein